MSMADGGTSEPISSSRSELFEIVENALLIADQLELHMAAIHLQSALHVLALSLDDASESNG
ncbi:hypothetical protein [Novosphingobium sp.]|uniref:hypothetical protein n=1 Tax=Novosphingobium sp. TaxID=1874826 RepID=UPI001D8E5742|nr:hypothetical protein [Novosphingobium sp.]MBX9663737.1 hypothetical protein [Novosphingobium sp.]